MDIQKFNWYAKGIIRKLLTKKLEFSAKRQNKVFSCRVLSGTAEYNLAVNSDMTVSCNCQDFDGAGKLGNFEENSLEEIISSEKASTFRKILASGRLPIENCSRCVDLQMVSKEEADKNNADFHLQNKNLMVENTICCACSCLACSRPIVMKQRKKLALTLEDIEKISQEIQNHKIESIAYFNLGDPFISQNILKELQIIRHRNPNVRIYSSTNGLFLSTNEKLEAATLLDHLVVSIDGINTKMVRKYQRNQNFETSFANMCNLVKYRNEKNKKNSESPSKLIVSWNYILFNWNDKPEYIKKAIKLCKENNIDTLNIWHTMSPFWGTSWRWYTSPFWKKLRSGSSSQYLTINIKDYTEDL